MEKLIPNTVIYDRFLLKEEIFNDPQTSQRTWALLDQQTDQHFIVRFHINGQTEWFADDRQHTEPEKNTIPENIPKKVQSSGAPPATGKRLMLFFLILIIPGALYITYYYRSPIVSYVKTVMKTKSDSTTKEEKIDPGIDTNLEQNTSATEQAISDSQQNTSVLTENKTSVNFEKETVQVSALKAIRLLNSLSSISADEHPAIFSNARKAFRDLRNSDSDNRFIDSVFTICAGKGAQSLTTHQQNGDPGSKKYAIEWYQTAYDLKPSSDLLSRLNRLKGISVKKENQPGVSSKKPSQYFQRDPELNQ